MIDVLCVAKKSIYKQIEGFDCWDQERDSYTYTGSNPVIAHPPCQQWSRLKAFANVDPVSKELAFFCLEKVRSNGGILEHPYGSSFFKAAGIKPTIQIDQCWFGFPGRKRTWLYFHGCTPLTHPLSFDLPAVRSISQMSQVKRSETTEQLALWLRDSIKAYL